MGRSHSLTITATVSGAKAGESVQLPIGTVVECASGNRSGSGRWAVVEVGTGRVVRTFASQVDRALWIGQNTEELSEEPGGQLANEG